MTYSDEDKKEFQKMVMVGVGQALEEIVLPRFDALDATIKSQSDEIQGLRNDIGEIQNDISRIDRKLDQVTDHQAEKLDDHERRLKLVEAAIST